MVSGRPCPTITDGVAWVSILLVMDDGLWGCLRLWLPYLLVRVSILLVMDDGLWVAVEALNANSKVVSILLVMDDGLWAAETALAARAASRLNPSCNG